MKTKEIKTLQDTIELMNSEDYKESKGAMLEMAYVEYIGKPFVIEGEE
ncbi:MAG: hypothetical protein GX675_01280 [Erysipelotrichaceae bacterium]|nr:hypothetical protein [Erysipelotrichaceae bacterium]